MTLLNKLYRSVRTVDPNTQYLYKIKYNTATAFSNSMLGEMPKGKQFGYIFTNNTTLADRDTKLAKTSVHEIGHGAFTLKHLVEYGDFTEGEESLDNVMDYPVGQQFSKLQWDYLHDPAIVFGFLQDEDQIAYVDTLRENGVLKIITVGETNFLTPSGDLLRLPDKTTVFFYCMEYNLTNGGGTGVPNGALYGFKTSDGREFKSSIDYIGWGFQGYYEVIKKGTSYEWKYANSANGKQKIPYLNNTPQSNNNNLLVTFLHRTKNPCDGATEVWIMDQNYNFITRPANSSSLFYPAYNFSNKPVGEKVLEIGMAGCSNCTTKDVGTPKVIGGVPTKVDELYFKYTEYVGAGETLAINAEGKKTLHDFFRSLGDEFKQKFEVFIYPAGGSRESTANTDYQASKASGKKAIKIEISSDGTVKVGSDNGVGERGVFNFDLWGFGIGNECAAAYVDKVLAENGSTNKVWRFCQKVYYGIKGVLLCKLGEQATVNYDGATRFVYGFTYEFLETLDVVQLLKGLGELGMGIAKYTIWEAPKMWVNQLNKIGKYAYDITFNGRIPKFQDALTLFVPDAIINGVQKGKTMAKNLYAFYVTNGNSWLYGQLTMMVVPLVLTLGEYSGVIAARLASVMPAFAAVGDAARISQLCTKMNRLTNLGFEIVMLGGNKVLAPVKLLSNSGGAIKNIDESVNAITQIESGIVPVLDDASDFSKVESFIDDIDDLGQRVTILNESEQAIVTSGLNKITNGSKLYVAIHGSGNTFEVVVNGIKQNLSHRSLATWIQKNYPTANDIVLLSCSDFNSAQNLANKLGNGKTVTAWEGLVKVYESGAIEGSGKCKKFSRTDSRYTQNFVEIQESNIPVGKVGAEKSGPSVTLSRTTKGSSELVQDGSRFVDDVVEQDYQRYLDYKAKQMEEPRGRAEWKEISDYFLFDSPLARGNRFDAKAVKEEWYNYSEIQIDGKYYLDGYEKGKKIVSRKGIDLKDIEIGQFEKYCQELTTKYKKGSLITTKKPLYDAIRNTILSGEYYLEIPMSNKTFQGLKEFEEIAKKYDIKIDFKPE
ncbi:MAG: hypothetical protein K2W79_06040 [Hydrotalea flava]|nr:hypothetical protein [Hydrotalea flava]